MKDIKLKHFLGLAFLILVSSLAIVLSIKLYQGLTSQIVADGFKMATTTLYILSLIVAGGLLVGTSVFLSLQWSSQWSSKSKDQNNELVSTITEIIKRQNQITPQPQNFTLNLKTSEHKSVALTTEEEEEEEKQKEQKKLLQNNKDGIY